MPATLRQILILLTLAVLPISVVPKAHAEQSTQQKNLETIKNKLKLEKEQANLLKQKARQVEEGLMNTKAKLVKIASDINENERGQNKTSKRIVKLNEQKEDLQHKLIQERKLIGNLILALKKLKQTPPQALLVSPQKPYKTAQTALLLRDVIPAINRHAKNLENNLTTLNDLTLSLANENAILEEQAITLSEKRTELTKLLKVRETLFEKTNNDISERETAIKKISLKATDLRDLVQRLRKQEEVEQQEKKYATLKAHLKASKPENIEENTKDQGPSQPIVGAIKIGFNQKDSLGAKSKGVTFEGRANALVIAPLTGKVQFTGEFKKYGNIVIIEHNDNYHSLIAGLDKITTKLGAYVKSGEPIGTLPNSSLNPRPTLYYEFRKNGKPVNPNQVLKKGTK